MNDVIYTVTTLEHPREKLDIKGGKYMSRGHRTVGYSFTFAEAKQWLYDNTCDLNEGGFYPLAVIECFPEGIYPMIGEEYEEHWFEWDNETEAYRPTDKPEEFKRTIGFGLG